MDLIIADKVSFSYGSNEIFSDVSLTITYSTRLALVGRNGLGKTTLLRVLAGELEPTLGEIFRKIRQQMIYIIMSIKNYLLIPTLLNTHV